MDLLRRELAPILPEAWRLIDDEARRVLRLHLAGRKLVDFIGPLGWKHAAVNTGRVAPIAAAPTPGVRASVRVVAPLVEIHAPFELSIDELDAVARGAEDIDLGPVVEAAERVARAEDGAIFHGYDAARIAGVVPSSGHDRIPVKDASAWPEAVVRAKEVLRAAGVDGPYAMALGPKAYDEVAAASEDGYPILKRLERIIEGPLVWAPALSGAVLLSTRGGDFELTVGQDLAIGYTSHQKRVVELYLTGSFTFRVLEATAAVALAGGGGGAAGGRSAARTRRA